MMEPVKIWFGPGRFSRRLREETGLSPFGVAVKGQPQEQGRHVTETTSVSRVEAPGDIAKRLGLRPNTEVVRRETVYLVDGEPVQFGITYIPATITDDDALAAGEDLYAHFEELGWPVALIREEISARMPTPEETAILRGDAPVIELIHTSMDDWKRPFEVTRFVMRADRAGLEYEVPIED
jgi:GntR family transcriptional regulator